MYALLTRNKTLWGCCLGFWGLLCFCFEFFYILFSPLNTNKVSLCFKTKILIWSSWLRPDSPKWATGSMSPFAEAKRLSTLVTCFWQWILMNSQGMNVWIGLAYRDYSQTYPLSLRFQNFRTFWARSCSA